MEKREREREREMEGRKKGDLKIHIAVDVKSKKIHQ
jgi:hypothetical protein